MPSSTSGEHIYSPDTLAVGLRNFEQQMVVANREIAMKLAEIDRQKREAEQAMVVVRSEADKNWLEKTRIAQEKTALENKEAMLKREQALHEKREREIAVREDQRRRNRTASVAFIEDLFADLSPKSVVENITNTSPTIKKHAMDNISACIAGFPASESSSNYVRFTPQDIAPYLLHKLHQLVSTSDGPLEYELKFAETVLSAPPVAKALALSGQCPILSEFLIEKNELASNVAVWNLAVCSFRRMVVMETSVVKPAYEALSRVIPRITVSEFNDPAHPSILFIKEVSPKIIEDCFNNGLWSAVAPLASHSITSIREVALNKILILSQHSDRNQHGIVEAGVLGLLDRYYPSPSPPSDIIEFFVNILPLIAERLCRQSGGIPWLLTRLSDPSLVINEAVIRAFRRCVEKQDLTILEKLVEAEVLKKLDEPPTQPSPAITKLICHFLPVLAIPYARANAIEEIITLLDHAEASVADASLLACFKIVDSTIENRTNLFTVISRLNFAKVSTLKLYDRAMPAWCKDWVASGNYKKIVEFIQHSEFRVRHPAQKVWCDIVCNSPLARSKIVQDGLLDVIFELCSSQYDDAVDIGAKCCVPMALEITKAGANPTRRLVNLLNHPSLLLRQAALRAIQVASESDHANCEALLEADAFKVLQLFFRSYPQDLMDNAHCKILARLAPFMYASPEACTGLLELLESSSPFVERAARSALATISIGNLEGRQTLRTVVLSHLLLPSEALIGYSTKAIQDWIGPDLAQSNDFAAFFSLISHPHRRIQTASLISLRQKLSNSDYHESLEKANVIVMIRTLVDSDNPEALNFVMEALRVLGLSLARNGHSSTIISLLMHKEPKVRVGAAAALEAIASSAREGKLLVEEDIIGRLIDHEERLEQTQLDLLSSVIPKLAIGYLNIGKIGLILTLIDHPQQSIRTAATKSVALIAGGAPEQKACLRDVLLPRLDNASPLLREVAASCLSRTLAHDLVVAGDFTRLFRILQSEDVRIREPIIKGLQGHIQGSEEATRRRLVDAGILPATLQAYTSTKDDILNFISACVLPILGPSFTQNDGGLTLFPLLMHGEPRIRAATIQAFKNAMDSRHGNMENMAKACVIGTLHPLTKTDDAVRDLWCRILPKTVAFLENRVEIDILFGSLNDSRRNVREAASDALNIMAKTSEVTRGHMFPALLQTLENPSPEVIPLIIQAISLSGFVFVSNGKERDLLYLIWDEIPEVAIAAIKATTEILTKGNAFQRQKLLKAEVFSEALKLHNQRSHPQHSLGLLHAIIEHLSHELLTDDDLARQMFSLFDDPDLSLHSVLFHAWTNDSRVIESDALLEFLPLLFDNSKLGNPYVVDILCQVAPNIVPELVSRGKLDLIVKALSVANVNIVQTFLREICVVIKKSTEDGKDQFVSEPRFVSIIGSHLAQSQNTTMHRNCSTIVQLLSKGSSSRSGRIMDEGIGRYLSWLAVNGGKEAQKSSLDALHSLFMAAPDHADRLVADSLPALRDILQVEGQVLDIYVKALYLLLSIVKESVHSRVIKSGIVDDLVHWISPLHGITDQQCRGYVFEICKLIAEKSDAGRKVLISAKILPELSHLATSQNASEVHWACMILKALAHTGKFRNDIISAGLQDTMKNITSPFQKSTLQFKDDRQRAQELAKQVLQTLKLSKRHSVGPIAQINTASRIAQHSSANSSPRRPVDEDEDPEAEPRPMHRRRTSESYIASPEFNSPEVDVPLEPRTTRNLRHSRSLSETDRPVLLRTEGARLPAVREDQDATLNLEEEDPSPSATRPRRQTMASSARQQLSEDYLPLSDADSNTSRTVPATYRESGTVRKPSTIQRNGTRRQVVEDHLLPPPDLDCTSTTAPPPSYRLMSSVLGSIRGRRS